MKFLQKSFQMVVSGIFINDAEFQFMASTTLTLHIEATEGRLLNTEFMELIGQVHTEAQQRANLFTDVFFSNFAEHGVGAFKFAWAAVNGQNYSD